MIQKIVILSAAALAFLVTSCEDSSNQPPDVVEYVESKEGRQKFLGVWLRLKNLEQTMTIAIQHDGSLSVTENSSKKVYRVTQVANNRLIIHFDKHQARWGLILDKGKLILRTNTKNKEVFVQGKSIDSYGDMYQAELVKEFDESRARHFSGHSQKSSYAERQEEQLTEFREREQANAARLTQFDRGRDVTNSRLNTGTVESHPPKAIIVEEYNPNLKPVNQSKEPRYIRLNRHGEAALKWNRGIPFYRKLGAKYWTEGVRVAHRRYEFEVNDKYIMKLDFISRNYQLRYYDGSLMRGLHGTWSVSE